LFKIGLFRTIAYSIVPIVMMLLASRAFRWNYPFLFAFLSMATAIGLVAWHVSHAAMDLRRVRAGEFHEAVFRAAERIGAPLKRLYIEPANPWRSMYPIAGTGGELIVPEGLMRTLSRAELDAMIGYTLISMRNGHAGRMML